MIWCTCVCTLHLVISCLNYKMYQFITHPLSLITCRATSWELTELKQAIEHRTVLSNIDCKINNNWSITDDSTPIEKKQPQVSFDISIEFWLPHWWKHWVVYNILLRLGIIWIPLFSIMLSILVMNEFCVQSNLARSKVKSCFVLLRYAMLCYDIYFIRTLCAFVYLEHPVFHKFNFQIWCCSTLIPMFCFVLYFIDSYGNQDFWVWSLESISG